MHQNGQTPEQPVRSLMAPPRTGLESYRPPAVVVDDARMAQARPAGSDWVQLTEMFRFVRRNGWVLSAFLVCGVIGAMVLTKMTVPVYRATSMIEVLGVNEEFLNLRNMDPTGRLPAESYLFTQVEILQNEALIRPVVEKFQLEKLREFNPSSGMTERIGRWFDQSSKQSATPLTRAVQAAQAKLEVTPSRQSRIIRLSFDSGDPQLATDFVNAIGQAYIEREMESRAVSAAQVRQWLRPQLGDLKAKVDRAEAQLQAFSHSNGLVFTGERDSAAEERLRQLQRDLAIAQSERITRQSLLDMAKNATADAIPPSLDSGALRDLRLRITELKRQRAEVGALFTEDSQRVQRIQAQIDELEAAFKREMAAIPQRAENDYRTSRMREEGLSREYSGQVGAVLGEVRARLRYDALKHEVETNRRLYDAMSDRMNEADVAVAIKPVAAKILSAAKYPNRPYRPNLPLNIAFGLGAGLCMGLVVTGLREIYRRGIASPFEASALLQLPSLGAVPSAGIGASHLTARLLNRGGDRGQVELASWRQKQSFVSESFREILTSLLLAGDQRVLLITSPEPAEGKTTVACNLAIALSEIGKRVLLIDGDLRKPSIHRIFRLPNTWGLANILDGGEAALDGPTDVLVSATDIPRLSVICGGPHNGNFSLLHSARMESVLNRFRGEFDYVLIDSPPALHFGDARLLARVADGVLLVVRANHTNSMSAREAAVRLEAAGGRILGMILNRSGKQAVDYAALSYRYKTSDEG